MKLNALSRGVPLSSLVLAAFAVAGCGDKDAAETPAAPKAASTAAPASRRNFMLNDVITPPIFLLFLFGKYLCRQCQGRTLALRSMLP